MSKKAEESEADEKKGGKGKLIIIVVVALLLVGGAGYWFVLKPKGSTKVAKPDPGVVVKLDSIQVNLADDHYLKIGVALQATKKAGAELDGSKALDQTIDLFSGQDIHQLARRAYREKMKKKLDQRLDKAYEGDVMGAYFTDFVTQ
jgi:flagellar FliL protein